MSTPIRVERRRADRLADLQADRPDARRRRTTRPGATADGSDARQRPAVDAVRGCRGFPITASTDWYAPIRTGGTPGVAPPRQIHAQSWAPSGVAKADLAPRRQIRCLPVCGHGFGKSGDPAFPAGGSVTLGRAATRDVGTAYGSVSRGSPSPGGSGHRPPAGWWHRGPPAVDRQVPPRRPHG